jgi:inosine-uridine nucleoside N-ribohydrolase
MYGSLFKGYGDLPGISAEYNVVSDITGLRTVIEANWSVTLTPVDTCGQIMLSGERYRQIFECRDPLVRALMENFECWANAVHFEKDWRTASSILYDTAAVYLAFSEQWVVIGEWPLLIDDQGYTRVDPSGSPVRCATAWKSINSFHDFLADRIMGTR